VGGFEPPPLRLLAPQLGYHPAGHSPIGRAFTGWLILEKCRGNRPGSVCLLSRDLNANSFIVKVDEGTCFIKFKPFHNLTF
jgi:hypothetical protein